jgi:hypothetical protein
VLIIRQIRKIRFLLIITTFVEIFMSINQFVYANDSAGEIVMGGIRFTKEENISIEREDLSISLDRIDVSYCFRNDTDKNITTILAFPIPEYNFEFDRSAPSFSDFSVEVNGSLVKYQKDIKAFFKGKDFTSFLNSLNISFINFDGFDNETDAKLFIKKLKPKDYESLTSIGLLSSNGFPEWTVSVKYYWQQTFPSHSITTIKHSYTPESGYLGTANHSGYLEEKIGRPLTKETERWLNKNHNIFSIEWVSYILITANNWNGPINEFNLIIKKNKAPHIILSFEDKVISESSKDIIINIQKYIPKKDLIVFYLEPNY